MAGSQKELLVPEWHSIVGIILALSSGLFIGLSLVLQKKGLLETESQRVTSGNEYSYLKSKFWWIGIICMAAGELCNFGAYGASFVVGYTNLNF